MAEEIELKKFAEYLQENPPKGSAAPPRTVPAKVLDKNFKRVTVIKDPEPDESNDRTYTVKYTDDGTVLKLRKFPRGVNLGDLAYWNPEGGVDGKGAWVVLEAVQSEELHVLGIKNGELQWVGTDDCEEEGGE
jgi:hypothetical protein